MPYNTLKISKESQKGLWQDYAADWLAHQMRRGGFPGLSVAAIEGGLCSFRLTLGLADLESGEALTSSHLFRAASHAKIATAAAVLQLADAQRLDLDAPIADLLPFLGRAGTAARGITARRILSHAAGIMRDGPMADFWQGSSPFPDRAGLAGFFRDPADFLHTGPNFKYSNIGYALLGLLVEAVTGQEWNRHVREAVFEPLGLGNNIASDFDHLPHGARCAKGYGALYLTGRREALPCEASTRSLAPSAGICAAPESLALLFARLLHPARTFLLPESLESMTTAQASVPGMIEGRHYGYGVIIDKGCGPSPLLSHLGLWPGHMSKTFYDPAQDLAVSIAINAVDGGPDFLLRGLMAIRDFLTAQGPPEAGLEPFSGRYVCAYAVKDAVPAGGHVYLVSPDLQNPFCNAATLRREEGGAFRIVSDHGFGAQGERAVFGTDGRTLTIAGVTYRRET